MHHTIENRTPRNEFNAKEKIVESYKLLQSEPFAL